LQKGLPGVPYQSRPISINTPHESASDVDDTDQLSWRPHDDVTAGDQLATEADIDMLIDRYSRLNTYDSHVGTEPRSDEVQQLIKVLNHSRYRT